MRKISKCLLYIFIMFFMTASPVWTEDQGEESGEGVLVGRISHIEGQLLRYVTRHYGN